MTIFVADARVTLAAPTAALPNHQVSCDYTAQIARLRQGGEAEVDRLFHLNT
jgi:hypothetical protein